MEPILCNVWPTKLKVGEIKVVQHHSQTYQTIVHFVIKAPKLVHI